MFDVTDRSLPQSGALGVWSRSDSVSRYGSLLIGLPPAAVRELGVRAASSAFASSTKPAPTAAVIQRGR